MATGRAGSLRRFWQERSSSWDHHVSSSPAFAQVLDVLLEKARPQPADRAADLGAGTGFVTLALAPRVGDVLAVDLAPTMLQALEVEAAARGVVNIATRAADIGSVDLPPASLDLVVSSYALHHLTDQQKRALLARVRYWLRPEGRVAIADMMFGRGATAHDRRIIWGKVRRLARKGPGRLWRIAKNAFRFGLRVGTELPATPVFWTSELRAAGFEAIGYQAVVAEAGVVWGHLPLGPPSGRTASTEHAVSAQLPPSPEAPGQNDVPEPTTHPRACADC